MIKRYLPALALVLVLFLSSCAGSVVNAGGFDPKDYGKVDPAKWQAENQEMDWYTPTLVYIGHRTTELTQPLMPDDDVIHVKSTDGFLQEGWVKVWSESIHYTSKTDDSFVGCERSGERTTPLNTGTLVAMLERGYYQLGTLFEQTVTVHFGGGEQECEDTLKVTTWPDETAAYMPLKYKLSNINSVVLISSIPEDKFMRATSYDAENNQIWVEGFKSDTTRILTIRYQGYAEEMLYNIIPTKPQWYFEDYAPPPDGFQSWITLSEQQLLLKVNETKQFTMRLLVPEGAVTESQRWSFWVDMMEAGMGNSAIDRAVTFQVNMAR